MKLSAQSELFRSRYNEYDCRATIKSNYGDTEGW